ncbi:MAG: transglycosylase domain-containing protein [Bryobacteraceae bacterium]
MPARKVKVRSGSRLGRFVFSPLGKIVLGLTLLAVVGAGAILTHFYVKYANLIDQKLSVGPFARTSKIYAAPRVVSVGDVLSTQEAIAMLRRAGYGESRNNRTGWYHVRDDAIEVFPGPEAIQQEAAVLKIADHRVTGIVSAQDNTRRTQYLLEPELITNLSDRKREKRRLVNFEDIPPVLVNAVISVEDKRFFQHSGFDPMRIAKAAYVDLREGYKKEGASTLSMQLARGFWLNQSKSWRRKAAEVLITMQLEQRLTKKEIFEYYSNNVDLGRRGSFAIAGFGQAAQAYFGKDIRQIDLPEAAMLAGLIQLPSYYNPFRHPERMKERRNVVLSLMRSNGYINDREYALAAQAPLRLVPGAVESSEAPYFVDLVNDELQSRFQDRDFRADAYRIYTTLDANLQHAAVEAVQIGMENVDQLLRKQKRFKGRAVPEAQAALVAMDPHTGEIKALVGGRNYGNSQLNRVLAKRQPGSAFKPFVYTVAINTALQEGAKEILTPSTRLLDEPTTFWFDDKPYEPGNFGDKYNGEVTLRQAMAKSLNVPTVKLAEMVGYDRVVDLAKQAGMNYDIKATPAIALGAYEVTPIEVAGAYTIFSNNGMWVKPHWISTVRASNNSVLYTHKPDTRQVLDPRVVFIMTSMLEEVTRTGTAAGIRSRGITAPVAGKTGSSKDGWFSGFTSRLMCVVWVGFDDNADLGLTGDKSALPVWSEFMKRALLLKEYRDAKPFEPPEGVTTIQVDPLSGQPATPNCPTTRMEVYVTGTEPLSQRCFLHGGGQPGVTHVAGWDQPAAPAQPVEVAASTPPPSPSGSHNPPQAAAPPATEPGPGSEASPSEVKKRKKGFLDRLLGVFK